jgi:hypothetical protein
MRLRRHLFSTRALFDREPRRKKNSSRERETPDRKYTNGRRQRGPIGDRRRDYTGPRGPERVFLNGRIISKVCATGERTTDKQTD